MRKFLFTIIYFAFVISLLSVARAETTTSVSASTPAATAFETPMIPNINQGDLEISGTGGFGATPSSYGVSLSPTVRFFVLDHLALGLTGTADVTTYENTFSVGPSAAFYFLRLGNWEMMAAEDLVIDTSTLWRANSRLGADYFITPKFEVGPALVYSMPLADNYNSVIQILIQGGVFF